MIRKLIDFLKLTLSLYVHVIVIVIRENAAYTKA